MFLWKISIQFLFVYLHCINGDTSNYNYNHPPFSDTKTIPVAIVYDDQLVDRGRSVATTDSIITTYNPRIRKNKALEESTESTNLVVPTEKKLVKSDTHLEKVNYKNNYQIPVAIVYEKIDEPQNSANLLEEKDLEYKLLKQNSLRGNFKAPLTKETATVAAESVITEATTKNYISTTQKNDDTKKTPESLKIGTERVEDTANSSAVMAKPKINEEDPNLEIKSTTINVDVTENIQVQQLKEDTLESSTVATPITRRNIQRGRRPTTVPPITLSETLTEEITTPESNMKIRKNRFDFMSMTDTKQVKSIEAPIYAKESKSKEVLNIDSNKDIVSENTKISPNPMHEIQDIPKRTRTKDPVVPILKSQNYVFSHSGDFHYSYESGDGTKAFEEGSMNPNETVIGGFSYKDKDGNDVSLTYEAGVNGYRPVGAHLPTPPPIPPAIARALKYLATKTTPAEETVTESL